MEAIAREAGVGVGTLYRHFPKRIDVVEAVYRTDVDTLVQTAERGHRRARALAGGGRVPRGVRALRPGQADVPQRAARGLRQEPRPADRHGGAGAAGRPAGGRAGPGGRRRPRRRQTAPDLMQLRRPDVHQRHAARRTRASGSWPSSSTGSERSRPPSPRQGAGPGDRPAAGGRRSGRSRAGRPRGPGGLAAAVRRLAVLSVTTLGDEDPVLTADVDRAADLLASLPAQPRGRVRPPAVTAGPTLHQAMPFDMVVGRCNPVAPPVTITFQPPLALGVGRLRRHPRGRARMGARRGRGRGV